MTDNSTALRTQSGAPDVVSYDRSDTIGATYTVLLP